MFMRICCALNKCGWLIILLHLFGWLVWYGVVHDVTADTIGGSFMVGCVFAAIVHRVVDILEYDADDNED